jgi:hypothetical protein
MDLIADGWRSLVAGITLRALRADGTPQTIGSRKE